MAGLDVSALLHALLDQWRVLVSVQDADGKPVTGLKKENFTVAAWASTNHISWVVMKVIGAQQAGSSDGGSYYTLEVEHPVSQKAWNSATQKVITVAVHDEGARGQCLAYCPFACCLDRRAHPR